MSRSDLGLVKVSAAGSKGWCGCGWLHAAGSGQATSSSLVADPKATKAELAKTMELLYTISARARNHARAVERLLSPNLALANLERTVGQGNNFN